MDIIGAIHDNLHLQLSLEPFFYSKTIGDTLISTGAVRLNTYSMIVVNNVLDCFISHNHIDPSKKKLYLFFFCSLSMEAELGDYKKRLTWTNESHICIDNETGKETDIMVKFKNRPIARIQVVRDGPERGRCNCNTYWYPPVNTIQTGNLEEGIRTIVELHRRVKLEIKTYYHALDT
tara:strand:+ start:1005 stop:1535 length:531 start_codon:yes stop_codon:yes gene_type:complete